MCKKQAERKSLAPRGFPPASPSRFYNAGSRGESLQDLLSLCRCAGALTRPSGVMGRAVEPTYTALQGAEGRQWVCVGSARHVALIERHDGADLAPVVAQSLRAH